MGKKGRWFSAIKRVFTHSSKENTGSDLEKRSSKEKKRGLRKLKNGDTNSFLPTFEEPSSIEKIFGEFQREQELLAFQPPLLPEQPKTPPFVPPRTVSPKAPTPRSTPFPRVASPQIVLRQNEVNYRPEPTLRSHHASATKIQAACRGYVARRNFRALKGLVRLQRVVRGQNVKKQTVNAMKYMQLLVRVQSQIQSRRIQMSEKQAQKQAHHKTDGDIGEGSSLSKLTLGQALEAVKSEDWDDSLLTKEGVEASLQRKVEAVIRRQRAMAYAHSHLLWKSTPKSNQIPMTSMQSGDFPGWWNWLEPQLPSGNQSEIHQALKNFQLTPPWPFSEWRVSPRPPSSTPRQHHFGLQNSDTTHTPKSSKSTALTPARKARTPVQSNSSGLFSSRYSKPKASGGGLPFDFPMKDDDSLTSCPAFSVPNYMAPTVSARAKVRGNYTSEKPKEVGDPRIPSRDGKRGLSFRLTQGIGSFKWTKGYSLFSSKEPSNTRTISAKNQPLQSLGNLSLDSTVSLPAGVIERKPFNRFV